jgi:hypothetical protein
VTAAFLTLVACMVLLSLREWALLLSRRKPAQLHEAEPVWLSAATAPSSSPLGALGAVALGIAMLEELSGEAAISREQAAAEACDGARAHTARGRQNAYLTATNRRFTGIRRCC